MTWVNKITMSLVRSVPPHTARVCLDVLTRVHCRKLQAMQMDRKADLARERLAASGTISWADLNETVSYATSRCVSVRLDAADMKQNIKSSSVAVPCQPHGSNCTTKTDLVSVVSCQTQTGSSLRAAVPIGSAQTAHTGRTAQVRSLGGDFKYMKDPELLEMQQITAKELRFVAPLIG
jgi:hypothetical protein